MESLSVANVVKVYGRRRVVDQVNLNVNRGEIVGLLGPNGAGKTTTFYMVVGIIRPDQGRVLLNGEDITQDPMYMRARKAIGYLSQEPSVFRKLTVEQNLRAILEFTPLSEQEQSERLERLLGEFHVEHLRHAFGYSLSGGERRRVEIARALALEPKFILLDEPFAGVDPIAVADIQNIVRQLRAKNLGVLITDHSARELLEIVDRAYVISAGRVLITGTPAEIAGSEIAKKIYLGEKFHLQGVSVEIGSPEIEDEAIEIETPHSAVAALIEEARLQRELAQDACRRGYLDLRDRGGDARGRLGCVFD